MRVHDCVDISLDKLASAVIQTFYWASMELEPALRIIVLSSSIQSSIKIKQTTKIQVTLLV